MNFFKILFLPITAPIKFIQDNFKTVLFLTIAFIVYSSTSSEDIKKANLQKIDLVGTIMNADEILAKIQKAKEDKNIKGVLLNVNSPGGAVAPSVEIYYAIKDLATTKPVVAYASGTMASGSYYGAVASTKIIANPGSIIGSIGVIMQSVDLSELMAKIGIKTQTVKAGKYKEAGTFARQWTKAERDELEKITQNTYNMFVSTVAKERGLKLQNHTIYANAHIFTAHEALKVKLIDKVAPMFQAKQELVKLSKVKKPIWSKEDKLDKFMEKLMNKTISNISTKLNTLVAY